MGLFRMGECARERAWTPEAKNPFSPAAPEPFPTVPPQRDSVGGQLEAARGVLLVSDRAAGPGWWRPLPHEGELGADCAQDKPLWQLGRAAQVESISGLADKPLVHKNAGRHWFPLGRTLATGTRASWWRWLPSRGMQTAGDASATARPPGANDVEQEPGGLLRGTPPLGDNGWAAARITPFLANMRECMCITSGAESSSLKH